MSKITRRYWKWDEEYNDTPYKLRQDINYLLQEGLVHPNKEEEDSFVGLGKGAPRIEASSGKVIGVYFGSLHDPISPTIQEGLWEMEEPKFTKTLNNLLGASVEPTHITFDHCLFVVFRDFFVTMAAILGKSRERFIKHSNKY